MAIVGIVFARAMDGAAPIIGAIPHSQQRIDVTGTAQTSTAAAGPNCVCEITNAGAEAVWVTFRPGVSASNGNDHLITAGQTRNFGFVPAGTTVSVINAT